VVAFAMGRMDLRCIKNGLRGSGEEGREGKWEETRRQRRKGKQEVIRFVFTAQCAVVQSAVNCDCMSSVTVLSVRL